MDLDGPGNGHGIRIIPGKDVGRKEYISVRIHNPFAGNHECAVDALREGNKTRLTPGDAAIVAGADSGVFEPAAEAFTAVSAREEAKDAAVRKGR